MDDRELLELAAKAADLPEHGWMGPTFMYVKDNTFTAWDPLTDDGDALRLAVSLELSVDFENGAVWGSGDRDETCLAHVARENWCFRRAIVRAAAGIGRAVP